MVIFFLQPASHTDAEACILFVAFVNAHFYGINQCLGKHTTRRHNGLGSSKAQLGFELTDPLVCVLEAELKL
jgi:hypothetical protein